MPCFRQCADFVTKWVILFQSVTVKLVTKLSLTKSKLCLKTFLILNVQHVTESSTDECYFVPYMVSVTNKCHQRDAYVSVNNTVFNCIIGADVNIMDENKVECH